MPGPDEFTRQLNKWQREAEKWATESESARNRLNKSMSVTQETELTKPWLAAAEEISRFALNPAQPLISSITSRITGKPQARAGAIQSERIASALKLAGVAPQEEERVALDLAVTNLAKASWYADFYSLAPAMVEQGLISSLDEYSQKMQPPNFLTSDEVEEVKKSVSSMAAARPVRQEDLPEFLQVPENKQAAVSEFLTAPTFTTPITLNSMTVSEILKSMRTPAIPPIPKDFGSTEEILAEAKLMGYSEEQLKESSNLTEIVKVRSQQAKDWEQKIADVKAGLAKWDMPETDWKQKAITAISQPATTFGQFIEPLITNISYPFAGLVVLLNQAVQTRSSDEQLSAQGLQRAGLNLQALYEKELAKSTEPDYLPFRKQGLALGKAYSAWAEEHLPLLQRLIVEAVFDPLNAFPGKALSVPAKGLVTAGTAMEKGILPVRYSGAAIKFAGNRMLWLNQGMYNVLDIPIKGLEFLKSKAPLAFSQTTRKKTAEFTQDIFRATGKNVGKLETEVTVSNISKTLDDSVAALKADPTDIDNPLVQLGSELREFVPADKATVESWVKKVGGDTVATRKVLTEVNDIITDFKLGRGTADDNGKRLAQVLGAEDTPATAARLGKQLDSYVSKFSIDIETAKEIGRTTKVNPRLAMMTYLADSYSKIARAAAESEFATGKRFDGIILALQQAVDAEERNSVRLALDKYAIRPLAEAGLGNITYAPYNIIETMLTMAAEGTNPFKMFTAAEFTQSFTGLIGIDPRLFDSALRAAKGAGIGGASDVAGMIGTMPGRSQFSILPSDVLKVPETIGSIFGKPIKAPLGLGGADWIKWVSGKGGIELSDMMGTYQRMSYLIQKYNQHLRVLAADYTINGTNVLEAVEKLANNPPALARGAALGITPEWLTKELTNRALTGDSRIVQEMKFLLTNGYLQQKELQKFIRLADWLSPQAKETAMRMIAENKVLSKVPVIYKNIDWDKIVFDGPDTVKAGLDKLLTSDGERTWVQFQDEVKKVVDELPIELKNDIKEIQYYPLMSAEGDYDPITKILRLGSEADIKLTTYHELTHSYIQRLFEERASDGAGFLWEFQKVINQTGNQALSVSDDLLAPIAKQMKPGLSYDKYKNLHEFFAEALSTWLIHGDLKTLKKQERMIQMFFNFGGKDFDADAGEKLIIKFLEERFPKKSDDAGSIINFIKTLADQSIADLKAAPTAIPDNFKYLAGLIEQTPVANKKDLAIVLREYLVMSETASNLPSAMIERAFDETRRLRSAGKYDQVRGLWNKHHEDLAERLESINTSLEQVKAKALANSNLLPPEQAASMKDLLDRYSARNALHEQYFSNDRALLDEYWSLPKNQREAQWNITDTARVKLHGQFKNQDAVLGVGDFMAKKEYNELFWNLPEEPIFPVDATSRALSSNDVARILGTNVDGVSKALAENVALQQREYFTQLILKHAEARPDAFKGITEAKVSAVYDETLSGMNFDPSKDIGVQRILQQAEELKLKLINQQMIGSLLPDEEKALHGWIDGAAKKVRELFRGGAVPAINLSEILPTPARVPTGTYPQYSPLYVAQHEDVPRYFYHVGKEKAGGIEAYKIREPKAADSFGEGYADRKYVWLSKKPVYGEDYFIIDITKLPNESMRFTGQVEGNLLHQGDIPASAIVGKHGKAETGGPAAPQPRVTAVQAIPESTFHKSVTADVQQRIQALVAVLPSGTELGIKRIMISPGLRTGGKFIESERILQLHPNFTDGDFYHEVAHAIGIPGEKEAEEFVVRFEKLSRSRMAQDILEFPGAVPDLRESWTKVRQKASDQAHKDMYRAFADYTNQNILDAQMKMLLPYWTYEFFRWTTGIPRLALKHPGIATTWGKYTDYTDRGHIQLPGLDLSINPFTSSMMGVTFGLARKDFQSYYSNLGYAGEAIELWERYGFYPNSLIRGAIALTPVFSGRPPELGTITPPIGNLGMELLTASKIPGVVESIEWLRDHILHENFRNYYVATAFDGMQAKAGGDLIDGQNGTDLWHKIQRKETLTPEEQELWDTASRGDVAWISALRTQFPQFRLKEDEQLVANQMISRIFEEYAGMSEKYQQNLWRNNLKPTDMMGGLPLELRPVLDQLWQWKLWMGRGQILMAPEMSDLYGRINEYWDRVKGFQKIRIEQSVPDKYLSQNDINEGWLNPTKKLHLDGSDWVSQSANTWQNYTAMVDALKLDPRFKQAIFAITPEGQVELAKKLGYSAPVRNPLDEAIDLYFSIQLKKSTDKYTGEEDWDFAGFWLNKESVRMALTPEQRHDFDAIVRKYETIPERLYRQVQDKYFRGYKAVPRILLKEYSEEQKALISEYYSNTTSITRKEEIRATTAPSGKMLISDWESSLTAAREKLRLTSPMLDFWLYVYKGTKPKTPASASLAQQYDANRNMVLDFIDWNPPVSEE